MQTSSSIFSSINTKEDVKYYNKVCMIERKVLSLYGKSKKLSFSDERIKLLMNLTV